MDSWSLKGGGRRHGLLESLGRSAGRGLLESQEEARDMDSQSHEQERGTWTLGVSRGRKRHGLLKSQENVRDVDSWSLERRRETWTPGVLRESDRHELMESQEGARGMDSWSL